MQLEHHQKSACFSVRPLTAAWVRSFLAAGTLLVLFAGGCGRGDRAELRLAMSPWPGYEFLYLAQEKGFFDKEGLNAHIVEYASLNDSRVAFESGHVNVLGCTLIEVLQARDHGRSPQIVLVTDYSKGADVILARTNLASMAELKGRRVGLELGSLGTFMLARAQQRAGLNLYDVQTVSCLPDRMQAALAENRVDAVVAYPPVSVVLEAGGQVRRVFSSAEIPGEVVDVLAADELTLRENPGLALRVARVFQRALDYTRAHPEDAYKIMAQREGLSAAQFEPTLQGVQLVDAAGQSAFLGPTGSLVRSLKAVDDAMREASRIESRQQTNVAPLQAEANPRKRD
jgi:NitT/TauT family transport system substrate-binding protein